jgi:hypothetical protein
MKTYMIMTHTGPVVILTSHPSLDEALAEKLAGKGIDKFLACEIPTDLAEKRYGTHFAVVKGDLRETDDLRVVDEDGARAFKLFPFSELGPAIAYERCADHELRHAPGNRDKRHSVGGRYYMRLTDGKSVLNNHQGIELPGVAAARDVALGLARDLKNDAAMLGWNWKGWFVTIVDAHGHKVDEIPIAAA